MNTPTKQTPTKPILEKPPTKCTPTKANSQEVLDLERRIRDYIATGKVVGKKEPRQKAKVIRHKVK
mgnify:FL=1